MSRELLQRAKARLDRLELYPKPVDLRGVRIVVAPWLFRIPGFRRFRGYATRHLVLLKHPALAAFDVLARPQPLQSEPLRGRGAPSGGADSGGVELKPPGRAISPGNREVAARH